MGSSGDLEGAGLLSRQRSDRDRGGRSMGVGKLCSHESSHTRKHAIMTAQFIDRPRSTRPLPYSFSLSVSP